MAKGRSGGGRQPELFPRSKTTRPIPIEENHRLVQLADRLDWTGAGGAGRGDSSEQAEECGGPSAAPAGAARGDGAEGDPVHDVPGAGGPDSPLRPGAVPVRADGDGLVAGPQHAARLLRADGRGGDALINEYAVEWAVDEKLADPSVMVGDTTAQEAAIPHPNEMGLMAAFINTVAAASRHAGSAVKKFVEGAKREFQEAKKRVREYRLFAKSRTKAAKNRMVARMANLVERVNKRSGSVPRWLERRGAPRSTDWSPGPKWSSCTARCGS